MLRRQFIRLSSTAFAASLFTRVTGLLEDNQLVLHLPDEVWARVHNTWFKLVTRGRVFTEKGVSVSFKTRKEIQSVFIQAPDSELQGIRLKWKHSTRPDAKVLGDHWERSYGDLGWTKPDDQLQAPWYMMVHDDRDTIGFGVKTGAAAMCWWALDGNALSLTLDTHSGGMGVKLGQRTLHAADLIGTRSRAGENPYQTTTRFCSMMCNKPLLPEKPVYGINDWYVVYGNNSAATIRKQTTFMSEFVSDHNNRPFSVIDDGWQITDDFSLANDKFVDMHKMADEIRALGMRPGLWTRPLIAKLTDSQSMLAPAISGRNNSKQPILDPTIPETLERIRYNFNTYQKWGFELVKHDYTSYDIFGKWGSQMKNGTTQPGWKFYDQSKTNAEIIGQLYQTIRSAAGPMLVIGCNTLSHLSAGMFELNRTGDDTSGKEWGRTRDMGVNTLGFRLPQHNTFYAVDGDCIGLTAAVPWVKNRQWLQLLAESGSPLFISAEIDNLGPERKAAVKLAFAQASKVQPTGEPLDWMENQRPAKWKLNGREVNFDWG